MKFQVFLIYYKRGTGTEVDLRRVAATAQSRSLLFCAYMGDDVDRGRAESLSAQFFRPVKSRRDCLPDQVTEFTFLELPQGGGGSAVR